ncbi:MAG: hypothetical protein E7774_14665, partial [Bradyrhizobium sp.]
MSPGGPRLARTFLGSVRTKGTALAILVGLHHVTHYTYDRLVDLGPQSIRLRPAPHCRTRVLSYSLNVRP